MSRKMLSLGILLALLAGLVAGCVQPVPMAPAAPTEAAGEAAAGSEATIAPGSDQIMNGGTWTRASLADASNLNPILQSDTASSFFSAVIFPGLVGQDPVTGQYSTLGSMSKDWEISEDGLTYTFHLRDGVKWSDGEPVDAADFKFTYDAVASDKVDSPRKYMVESIESIETPDPLTIVIKFKNVKCDALTDASLLWLPSHLYGADFSDIMDSPDNEAPRVTAGPFAFQSWEHDDNTIVTRNEVYWEGAPHMDGLITRIVPNSGARLAQLQSGEIDITGLQPEQVATAKADPNLNLSSQPTDGYEFIGLNLANPANPQPGLDENGEPIPQEPHPILGDVRVRQAIAYAIDYDAIINDIWLGQGQRQSANVLPAVAWAYDKELSPYNYDPDKASALLDEAGWKDTNGDGVREKDGKDMVLSLVTNAGNNTREDMGVYVQDQLKKVGIKIDFQAIDFGTLVQQLLGQTTDMYIIGWTGLGSDPNDDGFWKTENDVPGSGFNTISLQNPKLDELLTKGYSLAGCKPEERAPIYKEVQQIIHDEVPYIFLINPIGNTGYSQRWGNVDPKEWAFYYNVQDRYLKSLQP